MSIDISPKNENFESYINLLRSKNLCSSANRENDWTLDRIAIQEFNLKLIKDMVEELERFCKIDNAEVHEELAMKMLLNRLDWYNYVATGKLQDDFRRQHKEVA